MEHVLGLEAPAPTSVPRRGLGTSVLPWLVSLGRSVPPLVGAGAGLVGAGAGWLLERLAPPLPEAVIEGDGEATLLTHLLGVLVPEHLTSPAVRLALLRSPVVLSFGFRSGRNESTIRVGRGRLSLADGISSDVIAVVEADLDVLARSASEALAAAADVAMAAEAQH